MNGTNLTPVSTCLLPVRHWWQTRIVRATVDCCCGFGLELNANVMDAAKWVPSMECPRCKKQLNLSPLQTLAAVVAADLKRTAEKN
jgi:hypothetical protein